MAVTEGHVNGGRRLSEDPYADVLSRGGAADWRLSFQHFLTTEQQGFLLHPRIEDDIAGRKDVQIADIATGNGIWALGVAEKYSTAQVVGMDISDQQFPTGSLRLPNTKFEVHNAFDPVPKEYLGAFDVVHLRLTVVWIIDQDKDKLIRNLLSMLKPGGFLQWSEVSNPPLLIHEANGEVHPGIPKAWERCMRISGMLPEFEWLSRLPQILHNYDVTDTADFRAKPSRTVLLGQRQALEWTMREIYESMIKAGVPDAEKEYELSLKEAEQDFSEGKQFSFHWQTVTARKQI